MSPCHDNPQSVDPQKLWWSLVESKGAEGFRACISRQGTLSQLNLADGQTDTTRHVPWADR